MKEITRYLNRKRNMRKEKPTANLKFPLQLRQNWQGMGTIRNASKRLTEMPIV